MAHVANEKTKLLNRIKRMRGQIEAIERAVDADNECATVLQQATACRGALDGFIAEVIEDHIREHMVDPSEPRNSLKVAAAEEFPGGHPNFPQSWPGQNPSPGSDGTRDDYAV